MLAPEYYTSAHPTSQIFDLIVRNYLNQNQLTLEPNEYYLDVGSGRSKLSPDDSENSSRNIAIDISREMVAQTGTGIERVVSSAFRLPIRPGSVKGIYSFLGDAFSISAFFEQVFDSLETSGHFLLIIPSHVWATSLRSQLRIPAEMTVFATGNSRLFAPSFTMPRKQLESQLVEVGFHIRDSRDLFVPPDVSGERMPYHITLASMALKVDPYNLPILTVVKVVK